MGAEAEWLEIPVSFAQAGDGGLHDVVMLPDGGDVDVLWRGWRGSSRILVVIQETADPYVFAARWFSSAGEIELCGSGACAAADVIFDRFQTGAGPIKLQGSYHEVHAQKASGNVRVRLPMFHSRNYTPSTGLLNALLVEHVEAGVVNEELRTVVLQFPRYTRLEHMTPDFQAMGRLEEPYLEALVVTAASQGGAFDFRYFVPWHDLDESPIAVSATAVLGPYWKRLMGSTGLVGRQLSVLKPSFKLQVDQHGTWVECIPFLGH